MSNDNVTPFQPRTYAVKKALERYAQMHPAQVSANKLHHDIGGFVTDMLVDLYHLADEGHFRMHELIEKARKQAEREGAKGGVK